MSLNFRNRQVAGNICLVVFLAFMFTLLPGQLLTTNAYAAETGVVGTYDTPNANVDGATSSFVIEPVSSTDFSNTIQTLVTNITNLGVSNLVYKITYEKVNSVVYSVYLWVYSSAGSSIQSEIYSYVYANLIEKVYVPVWVKPPKHTSATPAIPAEPAIPDVTPATPATPAIPASVAKLVTVKATVLQAKQLKAIDAGLGKLPVPSKSNLVITVGKNKVFVPKIIVTSAKVVVIMPLTSTTLDAKAVNYKIGVIKAYLAAQGIKNVPVRFVFLNTNPKLKVSVKVGSYFSVATPKTLVKAISSAAANKAVVTNKAKINKVLGIKAITKK